MSKKLPKNIRDLEWPNDPHGIDEERSAALQQDMDNLREWAWTNNPELYDMMTICSIPDGCECPLMGQPGSYCSKCDYLKPELRGKL
jgi:hypothetical protein